MENLNLGEAFASVFQKDWWKKYLSLFVTYLLPVIPIIIAIAIMAIAIPLKDNIAAVIIAFIVGFLFIISAFVIQILINIFIAGYFLLYGHDRANDKNATYRPVFSKETLKEGFIAGVKDIIARFVMIPFVIALFIPLLIILISTFVLKIEIFGLLFTFILFIIGLFLISIPMVKIMAYFIKDMDLASLFHWGEAFKYSKGVKSAIWVNILPGLLMVLSFIFFIIVFVVLALVFKFDKNSISNISNVISIFLEPIIFVFLAFYYNLLGQYTYAAIKQNEETN